MILLPVCRFAVKHRYSEILFRVGTKEANGASCSWWLTGAWCGGIGCDGFEAYGNFNSPFFKSRQGAGLLVSGKYTFLMLRL
ncbi:hypothetical protein SAMN04487894_110164 [Niabella drilacis]|uniref:Uncharacterized protein n=1 Tax=Niabella drilacis (strain DSM 25811 / CCM 8410 / CCUG 62505 / LMG 26954 / E90) TaxID=1285928 RepID=A0A1G6VWV6_NIADE|nr:hypothetical protein SAMN04487894_110164 [Niabella drilacis]